MKIRALLAVTVLVAGLSGPATAEDNSFAQRAAATAQLLAGIAPAPGDPVVDRLAALECWKEQRQWMELQWSQVRNRLAAMERWRAHEVRLGDGTDKTLIYPFSGPDFLNAYGMAPNHARYIFFSLEKPGTLPDLDAQNGAQFKQLLQDVRGAFRDIFERNYFITDYMTKQLATPRITGSVPVLATMMALMDLRILKIEPVDLFPELTRAYEQAGAHRPRKLLRGVRIDFVDPRRGKPQQLYYFSLDASDKALEYYPEFVDWVGRNHPATVFLKSASYLLHDNQFAKTREMLLASADIVIQDDTGIPFRLLSRAPWQVRLYGKYAKPIKTLSYGYQKDLEAAYQARPETPVLPFPFGYSWRTQKSGLLVATRERN
ncbi:MAG TPA: hypothetical protein VGA73_12075 [Candidatus Binatia bacterium]